MRIGDWMQTYTGTRFYPIDPRRDEINIEDIAHALSMLCRFGGHTRKFYSVAEHCVRVSYCVDPGDNLWGLLHDATEAYLVDLPRPIKRYSRLGDEYQRVEAMLMEEIALRFGLPVNKPNSVERADKFMCGLEAVALMGNPQWAEKFIGLLPHCTMQPPYFPWTAKKAERRFMERFGELAPTTPPPADGGAA